MRTSISAIVAALALAWPAAAQVPTPKVELGTKVFELPRGETTETKGKIPVDLSGYWLVAEEHLLPGRAEDKPRYYPTLQLYKVDKKADGSFQLHWFLYEAPEAVHAKLKKGQAEQSKWTPDAADVAAIAKDVAARPPVVDAKLRGAHYVTVTAELEASTRESPAAKDAAFAVRSLFQPDDRPPFGQSYFVKKTSKQELSGSMTMGAVPTNAKGVPLPIGTKGTFRWIKLEVPAAASTPAATPASTP